MSPKEYGAAIAALGLTQVAAGRLFNVDPRTSRRWVLGEVEIPGHVEALLRIMVHAKVDPKTVEDIVGDHNPVLAAIGLLIRRRISLVNALKMARKIVEH